MRKLLVLCFGVLKTGKPFDPAIAMGRGQEGKTLNATHRARTSGCG
jgi:hypothetical protein